MLNQLKISFLKKKTKKLSRSKVKLNKKKVFTELHAIHWFIACTVSFGTLLLIAGGDASANRSYKNVFLLFFLSSFRIMNERTNQS